MLYAKYKSALWGVLYGEHWYSIHAYMYVESLYSPSMFLMGSFSFCLTYFVEIIVILLYTCIDVATININYS